MFWRQGDFGYTKQVVDTMMALCYPQQKGRSFKQQIESVSAEGEDFVFTVDYHCAKCALSPLHNNKL